MSNVHGIGLLKLLWAHREEGQFFKDEEGSEKTLHGKFLLGMHGTICSRYKQNQCESRALYLTALSFKCGDHRQTIWNIKNEAILYWGMHHLSNMIVAWATWNLCLSWRNLYGPWLQSGNFWTPDLGSHPTSGWTRMWIEFPTMLRCLLPQEC